MKLKLYSILAYLGSIPFVLFALYFLFDYFFSYFPDSPDSSLSFLLQRLFSIYILIIASFIAGSHWGRHLTLEASQETEEAKKISESSQISSQINRWKTYLPLLSNFHALLLWPVFFFCSFKVLLLVFGLVFLSLLIVDQRLFTEKLIEKEYLYTRFLATSIALISMLVSGIFS